MLSIFTLTALGAFGVSNTLTDVTDRADEDDRRDDMLDDDPADAPEEDWLDGDGDLIADLDLHAAAEDIGPPRDDADFALIEDLAATQGGLAPSAAGMDAAEADAVEVIAISVGLPGATAGPSAAEAGFRTALGAEDELTLNIAPDLPGQILAVHAVYDMAPGDEAMALVSTLNFYMQPEGEALPAGQVTGSEAAFIGAHGLQKLGAVDMGCIKAHEDPETGEVIVTEDTRQAEPPRVVANRIVTEISALFS
jgi:hypothetical protein